MIVEAGRKFIVTTFGMVAGLILALLGHGNEEVMQLLGACVLTFNGANAAVSWAYARGEQKAPAVEVRGGGKTEVNVTETAGMGAVTAVKVPAEDREPPPLGTKHPNAEPNVFTDNERGD